MSLNFRHPYLSLNQTFGLDFKHCLKFGNQTVIECLKTHTSSDFRHLLYSKLDALITPLLSKLFILAYFEFTFLSLVVFNVLGQREDLKNITNARKAFIVNIFNKKIYIEDAFP